MGPGRADDRTRGSRPLLAYAYIGSAAAFLLLVPFLWGISPTFAVFLMGLSICLPAATPVMLAKLTLET